MDYQNRYRDTLNRKAEFGATDPAESKSLANIENDLAEFKTCVDTIGTQLNNEQNKSEVKRRRSVIKRKLEDANTRMKAKGRGVEARQLSKQLNNYAERFQELMNTEKELTRNYSISSGITSVDSPVGSETPMMQLQTNDDTANVERNAADLEELERDILDLHHIQKELGGMVHEQGEITEHIETHVSKAADRVTEANKKLADASVLKSRNRRLYVCIGLTIGVPIFIILLVIIIVLAAVLSKNN